MYMSEDVSSPVNKSKNVNFVITERQTGNTVIKVSAKSNATAAHFLQSSPHGIGNMSKVQMAGVTNDLISHAEHALGRAAAARHGAGPERLRLRERRARDVRGVAAAGR